VPGGVRVLAEDSEPFTDVGNVGVGVRLVGITQDGGGGAGERGGEEPVAQVGLGTPTRAEVVGGAADRNLYATVGPAVRAATELDLLPTRHRFELAPTDRTHER
jgi:hypothetical protein